LHRLQSNLVDRFTKRCVKSYAFRIRNVLPSLEGLFSTLPSFQRPFASLPPALCRHIGNMTTQTYSEAWLGGPNSTQFYTRTYEPTPNPTKAAVVFIHGFAEHIDRYKHFHPLLAARGIAVFTFDQRGFGLTSQDTTGHKSKGSTYGKTSWKDQMGDIEWAVKHAQELYQGVPIFLMGHSMVRTSL